MTAESTSIVGRGRLREQPLDLLRAAGLRDVLVEPGLPRVRHVIGLHVSADRDEPDVATLRAVAKYMSHRRKPASQTWRAFLEHHLRDLVALDSS